MSESQPLTELRSIRLTQLAIAAVAVLAFLNSARNQFVLDDFIHLVNNPNVRTLSAGMQAFFEPIFPGNLYRPLLIISYALTYHFFELSPLPYHLTNISLHALNAVLVFRLIFLFAPLRAAGLGAFLFAVHPLASEVVANVSGRSELLWCFFGLISLSLGISYVQGAADSAYQKSIKFGAIFTAVLLALLSKESASNLLVLIPLCLCFSLKSIPDLRRATIVFIAIILAFQSYLYLRINALGSLLGNSFAIDFLDNPIAQLPLAERVANALLLLGRYLSLILAPLQLSSDYSYAAIKPASLSASNLLYVYLLAVLLLVALIEGRKRILMRMFALWFFAAFTVTSNIFFPIGTIFAERLSYVPMIGILALIALCLEAVPNLGLRNALVGLLCMFFVLRTSERNLDWYNAQSLHSRDIEIVPQSAKAQMNFGVALRNQGELDRAEQYIRKSLRTYPAFADAAYNLGLTFLLKDASTQAREWLLHALNINPWHLPALDALARLALNSKDYRQAEIYFGAMLKIDPNSFGAQLGFLALNINKGEIAKARELYAQLIKRDPKNIELQKLRSALQSQSPLSAPPQTKPSEHTLDAHVA